MHDITKSDDRTAQVQIVYRHNNIDEKTSSI